MITVKQKIDMIDEHNKIENEILDILNKYKKSHYAHVVTLSCITIKSPLSVICNKDMPETLLMGFMQGMLDNEHNKYLDGDN